MLPEVQTSVNHLLSPKDQGKFEDFIQQFQVVSEELRGLIYRAICPPIVNPHGNVRSSDLFSSNSLQSLMVFLCLVFSCDSVVVIELARKCLGFEESP